MSSEKAQVREELREDIENNSFSDDGGMNWSLFPSSPTRILAKRSLPAPTVPSRFGLRVYHFEASFTRFSPASESDAVQILN